MPAIIQLMRLTGTGPTTTSILGLDVRADGRDYPDDGTVTTYPVPIPTSMTVNTSYWAAFQLYCAVAPTTLVSNFRIYSIGSPTQGPNVATVIAQGTAYTQASGSGGVGIPLNVTNVPSLQDIPSPLAAYTSASPYSFVGSTSVVGFFGNIIYMQVQIAMGASPGPTGEQQIWLAWDES